ncbi:MAG: MFS transporter [Pseudomonadales bacterium]|nr:MFS transporter [Pseudomonadales bacterium]
MNPVSKDSEPNFDSNKALWIAILIGVIGPEVFIVQPGFVQGLVAYLGFDEQSAGYVASAEMFGLAATTVLMTFTAHRFNWRKVVGVSVGVMCVANILCLVVTEASTFTALRFIAGLGAGSLVSLSFAAVGLTSNPDRNFGLLIMWVLIYGALVLLAMPTVYDIAGFDGLLIFFALFPLVALPFLRNLPISATASKQIDSGTLTLSPLLRLSALLAMLFYFAAQGAVWTYLFLIGTDAGLDEQDVANGLTLSQFSGIAGAGAAALIAQHFGRSLPLVIGILGGALCLYFFAGVMATIVYVVAVTFYNFFWNWTHPYLMAAMASFDRQGRVVVYAVAMQMIGLALGPGLAATVVEGEGYANVLLLGGTLFVISLLLVLLPLRSQSRQI